MLYLPLACKDCGWRFDLRSDYGIPKCEVCHGKMGPCGKAIPESEYVKDEEFKSLETSNVPFKIYFWNIIREPCYLNSDCLQEECVHGKIQLNRPFKQNEVIEEFICNHPKIKDTFLLQPGWMRKSLKFVIDVFGKNCEFELVNQEIPKRS